MTNQKLKVLGIDSALSACSAAVWNQTVAASDFKLIPFRHVETLAPMIRGVMEESALSFFELDLIAVTVGPGSFTGLRTCLSTAKGLGLALKIPVHGVTTLEAVAFAAKREYSHKINNHLAVVLETRRDDFYFQQFDETATPQGNAMAKSIDEIVDILPKGQISLCGDGANKLFAALPRSKYGDIQELKNLDSPNAIDVAQIALKRMEKPLNAEPLYIHPPAAKPPENLRIIRS